MTKQTPESTTVILLAAGRGKRMLDLTRNCPKPLLKVGQLSLIEHHLKRLAEMGFRTVVINLAYLGEQIRSTLGDGSQFPLQILYSDESDVGALETAGGIQKALPLLESDPFIVINADIWCDFDYRTLLQNCIALNYDYLGCLVMVDNPDHNTNGDFRLTDAGKLRDESSEYGISYTFSGVAMYRKALFASLEPGKYPLAPLLREHISQGKICGVHHPGIWTDVGTPERLAQLADDAEFKDSGT